MSDKKSCFATTALMIFSFLGMSAANAQDTGCYTLGSLQGNYALIGDYGAQVAIALSTRNFDGNGNLTANFIVNEPVAGSTTGDRAIVTGAQTGTYTVNCDGTGVITTALTASTGATAIQMYDFIVTGARVQGGQLIATSLVDAQRTPSAIVPGGVFLSRSYTRLPDAGCYTLGSLQGNYALIGNYGAQVAIALSTRDFDGNGNLTANFIVNEPAAGSTTGDRTIVTGSQTGSYTVNCDGTGVITTALTASNGATAIQMYDFIITGARVVQGGQLIATSLVDAQRTPSAIVPGGVFLTRTYTRRPTLPTQ